MSAEKVTRVFVTDEVTRDVQTAVIADVTWTKHIPTPSRRTLFNLSVFFTVPPSVQEA
jgi:hypothetical protein